MIKQRTKLEKINAKIAKFFSIILIGPWKIRSIYFLSILIGYYLSSNLVSYLISEQKQKLYILIILLISIETIIRIRHKLIFKSTLNVLINSIDNIRLGATYAIVLEAFKLGS